jgi:hypothetical protein
MSQFHQAYRHDAIVSPVVRLLPQTQKLIILGQSKRPKEQP